jgi:endoglucanase
MAPLASATSPGFVDPADWQAYKTRFVDASGRVIDDGNGSISHSEGQGYGLLLAGLAGQQADFDLIWSFTRTELMLRDDGLAVWQWKPDATPHVTDVNNASDGDLLIAYALALGGDQWQRPDLTEAAAAIARALAARTVIERQGRKLLLPAVAGFDKDDRPDGPVVNLSYWVFEAFPHLAKLVPEVDWQRLSDDGAALVAENGMGPRRLPPDWLSLEAKPRPAKGFPAEFGYNALRIPLYLMRAGNRDADLLGPFRDGMTAADGSVELVELANGHVRQTLPDAGYRIIPALISCVLDGEKLPAELRSFAPTLYYPSTLHLLGLSFVATEHPECLQ